MKQNLYIRILFLVVILNCFSYSYAQTVSEILNRAKAAIEKNDYVSAVVDLDSIISREPNNAEAYAQRARAYVRQNLDDKALPDVEKALSLDPKNVAALNVRGIVKRNKKDLDGAIADFKRVIVLDPNYAKAFSNLAVTSEAKNAPFQEVLGYYNSYIKLLPNDAEGYSYAGDYCLKNQGASDICAAYFTTYKKLKPESAGGYYGYALSYANVQNKVADKNFLKGEVVQNFRRAMELDPKNKIVPLQLGRLQLLLEDYDGGIISLTQAIALNPKSDLAYAMRGDCYRYKSEYDKAIADYSKAIKINPKYQSAYNLRGLSYRDRNITLKLGYKTPADKAEWEKAISDYQKYAELSNQSFEVYEKLNKFLEVVESVNREGERPAVFLNSNGSILQSWSDTSDSITKNWREKNIKYFESLIAVNPKNTCAYLFLSNNVVMKGAKTPYYEKAVNNFDGKNGARCSAEAAFNLGRDLEFAAQKMSTAFDDAKKLEAINTRVEAVKYFKLALQIDPSWTYSTGWVSSTTAKLEEMEALRKSINNSPKINDSSSTIQGSKPISTQVKEKQQREEDVDRLLLIYSKEIGAKSDNYNLYLREFSNKLDLVPKRSVELVDLMVKELTNSVAIANKALAEIGNEIPVGQKQYFERIVRDGSATLKNLSKLK